MTVAKILWTDEAIKDLEVIFDFLEQQSAVSAKKQIENILARVRQLETFPESGPSFKTKIGEYRFLVEGHFKIIYRFVDKTVYVATIFDTRLHPDRNRIK